MPVSEADSKCYSPGAYRLLIYRLKAQVTSKVSESSDRDSQLIFNTVEKYEVSQA